MSALSSWRSHRHEAAGMDFAVYRKGTGPGVIVIHEVPGLTPQVIGYAEELVAAGYTVILPELFGRAEQQPTMPIAVVRLAQLCVNREFHAWRTGRTSPVVAWLRDLARATHQELGGPGVGALGMCFTGGFALAMYVEPAVVAPVLAQPAAPLAVGARRAADLGLDPDDLDAVQARCANGGRALGLRYLSDPSVGTRFDTLATLLGEGFLRVELPGKGHSTLTNERHQDAVNAVLDFFSTQLTPPGAQSRPDTPEADRG